MKGRPIRQELSPGRIQSYRVTLDSGQYLRVLLNPQGMDMGVAIHGSGDITLAESICRQDKATSVSLIAEVSGTYRLEVRSLRSDSAIGHYELRIEEIRQASPEDSYRVTAEKAFLAGERLRLEGKADSQRKAIMKYEEALLAWRAAGVRKEEASTLKGIGTVYQLLGEPQTAIRYYEQAHLLSQESHDRREEGEILNDISSVYLALGNNQKALEYCTRALKLSREVTSRQVEAQALNNIGEVHYWSGNLQKALEYYQQSLPLWLDLGNRQGQAQTLTYVGYTYSDLGESEKASDFYKQALPIWQAINDHRGQALTLTAIGRIYSRQGESEEALRFFNQAKPLAQMVGDQIEQARILNNTGYVYERLDEKQNALDCYNQALGLFRSASYRNGEATTLHEIGRIYYSMGDNRKAFYHFQRALSMSRAIADRRLASYALRGIGMAHDSEGDRTKALKYYNRALPIYRAGKDRWGEAFMLNLIGRIYHSRGEKQKALGYYNRALLLNQAAGDRIRESLTLYNIACAERDSGRTAKAIPQIETSLKIVESLRNKVISRELRTSYFASVQQYYELYISLLMSQRNQTPSGGFEAAALEASERARARSLLELLAEARADIRQGVDPAVIERTRTLQQRINIQAERKMRLLSVSAPGDEVSAVAKEIDALIAERDQVEAQIRDKSPHYAELTQPQPSSLKEIQQLLDDHTLLLEYALGSEHSYLWAVTRTDLKSYVLPGRDAIEKAARSVYGLLISRQPAPGQTEKQRVALYWRQASALSRMLLRPVAGQLGTKRLLIVADGVLQYIPFEALPVPESAIRNPQSPAPLIVKHEIVNLPSASTLAVLRRETQKRTPAPKMVAVLADPVFEVDDLRVLAAQGVIKGPTQQVASTHPTKAFGGPGLTRGGINLSGLPSTRREAEAIRRVAPADGMFALGFDANRAKATGGELRQYRIVHFATHGILDSENPELSAIVLSLVDEQGRQQDGFLRLHDIYNLNLPAELVVLSACDSALGREIKGEGLVGLTRGFMYAGAARVMASLWKVDDEATAALMEQFYRRMLNDRMSPAAALREAQVAIWRQPRWRAPYYWAAFVMQGEWK